MVSSSARTALHGVPFLSEDGTPPLARCRFVNVPADCRLQAALRTAGAVAPWHAPTGDRRRRRPAAQSRVAPHWKRLRAISCPCMGGGEHASPLVPQAQPARRVLPAADPARTATRRYPQYHTDFAVSLRTSSRCQAVGPSPIDAQTQEPIWKAGTRSRPSLARPARRCRGSVD
jgi:hypothetical protein